MGISQMTSAVMVFLTGLLPASCHKADAHKNAPPAVAATNSVARPITGNIGEITLTNHADTCVQFANGASCILTPKMLDHSSVRITLALESKNDDGDTKDFAVAQVVAKSGKPVEVAVGSMNVTFTPVVKE
jgi:hypothetical protein